MQELSSSSLSTSSRGSFLSRNAATLDRLAAMTRARGEVRAGSGATKNTRNFVFSAVDNSGGKEETVEEDAQVLYREILNLTKVPLSFYRDRPKGGPRCGEF